MGNVVSPYELDLQQEEEVGFDTSDLSDEEFERLAATDPLWFLQVCERIIDKQTKRLKPFVLSPEQRQVHDIFWQQWCQKKPVRLIILKARQLGISTWSQGIGYWMTSTRSHTKGLVLAHEKDTSKHIFQMTDRFSIYDDRHKRGLMPKVRRSSVSELTFGNPDKRHRALDPGLDSSMTIATADNKNAGHGWTGSFFQGSEVARWPRPELLSGVLNALTEAPYTFGILESTAFGASGTFYETWQKACEGQNTWTPIFLPWHTRPEYSSVMTKEEKSKFRPTRQEEKLAEAYSLTFEQLDWRRKKINGPECQGQGRDPEDVFREQYPLCPEEAFVSSGMTFFDMKVVTDWEHRIKQKHKENWKSDGIGSPVMKTVRIILDKLPGPVTPNKIQVVEDPDGDVTVYYPPEEGKDYIIGGDVAAGVNNSTSDWSVAYVLDRLTLRVCAKMRKKTPPDKWANDLIALGWFYNEAFVAPEANNVGVDCARIVACNYRRTAYFVRLDELGYGKVDGERPGFYTTPANRKQLYWLLRAYIRDETLICYDEDFWRECHDFIIPEGDDGKPKEDQPKARSRRHDDCVSAMAIAAFCNNPAISGPIVVQEKTVKPNLSFLQAVLAKDLETEQKNKSVVPYDWDENVGSY